MRHGSAATPGAPPGLVMTGGVGRIDLPLPSELNKMTMEANPAVQLSAEQEELRRIETWRAARANEPADPRKWGVPAPDWLLPSLSGHPGQAMGADPDPRRKFRTWLRTAAEHPRRVPFPIPGFEDPAWVQLVTPEAREELALTRIPVRLMISPSDSADVQHAKRAALDEHFKAVLVTLVCYAGETGDERCFDADDIPLVKKLGVGVTDEILQVSEGLTAGRSFVRCETLNPFFDSFLAWSRGFCAQRSITKRSLPGLQQKLTGLMLAALPFATPEKR